MKSRFYDPQIGRFLQPDSVVPDPMNPQSLNRYSGACPERSRRVLNNPLRYTDPTGHFLEGLAEAGLRTGGQDTHASRERLSTGPPA
jgi:RHS repeat-associated protein